MASARKKPVKGVLTLIVGILIALFLAGHRLIPTDRGIALIVESVLPWIGVLVIVLLLIALVRTSWIAGVGVLIPALVWGTMFGPQLIPGGSSAEPEITVATQNVGARLPEPSTTAANLVETDADIVTVQEIESLSGELIQERLGDHYDHEQVESTIGVWSKYPISTPVPVDLGLGWVRAFRSTIDTDAGSVAFYAVHMPSVRPGQEATRNTALQTLTRTIAEDDAERIILAGDLNAATTDRYFDQLDDQLIDTRQHVGGGFGFTWPSQFPVTRLDHIMVRGFTPVSDEVQSQGTSDHRAVVAGLVAGQPED